LGTALEKLATLHGSLWEENFSLHELTVVVRQQDVAFAALLNQIRHGELTDDDEALLRSREMTQIET